MSKGTKTKTATYVYAVVAAGADIPEGLEPVGEEPGELEVLDHRSLAAVVSDVPVDKPLGRRQDLMSHERVVNAIAENMTVLPMRFGGVVANDQAVVDELLEQNHDYFVWALEQLDGCVQFVLHGRYDQDQLLGRILGDNAEMAELSESIRGTQPDATYYERIRLGEMISAEVERQRVADAGSAEERISPFAVAVATKEATGEDGAVNLSVLVRREHRSDFEQAVDALGDEWGDRVALRLIGPVAPFDFLPEPADEDGA
ncbi:GvpL/GvpF family gas vesicle protein [Pseudonocardia sp. KRD291]|uniref:GvpL/GvpF family gas vesicle protein n=1 Tax=Pseudonocardia sp. KRD291 TaxID=2792007 RepID=UPI001C4A69FF|nr:GvpL/GvpF family gas vesicle protein [Pseudonocardia sp. KRD291]MBW0107078.1 GvpL/GvpF family gas vesicle protein [Pseudonocardia sp. KRD291]